MIIYGTDSSAVKTEKIINYSCKNCGYTDTTSATIYSKYFDVFWIPIFPIGKYAMTNCSHCKVVYGQKEFTEDLNQKVYTIKKDSKAPKKHFSGFILAGFLFLGIVFISLTSKNNTNEYIKNPLIGDVYRYYNEEENYYSTMKINKISKDSIYFYLNKEIVEKKSRIYKIEIADNYNKSISYSYSKQEVKDLFKEKIVYEIDR